MANAPIRRPVAVAQITGSAIDKVSLYARKDPSRFGAVIHKGQQRLRRPVTVSHLEPGVLRALTSGTKMDLSLRLPDRSVQGTAIGRQELDGVHVVATFPGSSGGAASPQMDPVTGIVIIIGMFFASVVAVAAIENGVDAEMKVETAMGGGSVSVGGGQDEGGGEGEEEGGEGDEGGEGGGEGGDTSGGKE